MDIQVEITWREEEREFYGGYRGRIIAAHQLGSVLPGRRKKGKEMILSVGNRWY